MSQSNHKIELLKLLKRTLRNNIKNKLKQLTITEKEIQSSIVVNKLFSSPLYQKSTRVSIYLSTENEINTFKIIQNIFASGKKCFIPRYHDDSMEMVILHSLQDLNNLPMTKWNIKQPPVNEIRENCFDFGGLDLIIVPGVAFTKRGDRIGHGKGYYDKFLQKCYKLQTNNKPKTIGLAFEEQIVSSIPIEESDMRIDTVLTSN